MKRAKVTFFMIAYNEEKRIQRAIQSVLDQTEPDVELYVRNNGSTDRTGEIVREMAAQDCRVHLAENKVNWRKDEAGQVYFTNEKSAVDIWPINRETLGAYVSFLDADDRLQPTFVEELLQTAQKDRAEIAVCGSVFMQDGITPVGERLPPPLNLKRQEEWGPAFRNHNIFVQLYNSFRTYWGKLFEREFFLKYYDEAWAVLCGDCTCFLDTTMMLRYLKNCRRLSCIARPLYLFTMGGGSTYINFSSSLSVAKASQAEGLYQAGVDFLNSINALTPENHQFLFQLNWAYCWESMEGLRHMAHAESEDLDRVIVLLNNTVASAYLSQNSETICQQIQPILKAVWEKSGQKTELYLRYPIRLMYAQNFFDACPESEVLPVLILGILCDEENQNLLGSHLLPLVARHFPGLQKTVQFYLHKNYSFRHNSLRNWWVEEVQQIDNQKIQAEALVKQLRSAFEVEQYEQASNILTQLSKKSPLNRDALYYRIQLLNFIGEYELAAALAASARVLFGLDVEMQQLCWFIFSERETFA